MADAGLHRRLDTLVTPLVGAFSGEVALAFQDLQRGESYGLNATRTLRAASLIKLPILVQALTEVAKGRISLEQRLYLDAGDQVGGSGVLHRLQPGLEPTLRDLLALMMIVSDNTATNLLIDVLGVNAVNRFAQGLGLAQTRLVGKLQLPADQQNTAQQSGEVNATCAADVLGLLLRLNGRELLPDALTDLALTLLKQQQFTEALARYLPTDPELTETYVTVASKSGCLRGLWHDAGLVYSARGEALYALVVMTEGSVDRSYGWDQEGMLLIAELSKSIYKARQLSE